MMVFIFFLLLMILPSSYTLPQKSQNQPLQVRCPGDFNATVGDVTGIGLGRFPVENIAECAEKCRQEPACNSFNYSPTHLHCVMYEETQPTAPKCEDFHFCMKNPPRLTTFAVDTTIQFRYARTSVHLEAVNPSEVPQQFPFIFTLPETAFVMNMSLTYDGVEHVARVEEKELSEQQYQESVYKGETAAQVKKTERDSNRVSVDVNIEPGETISMVVTYEELLDRKLGRYKYRANINPGSIVDNYTVNININESLPIKDVQSFKVSDNTLNEDELVGLSTASEDVALGDVEVVSEKTARITYNPSRQDQEQQRVGRHGITGQINVEYDVDRNNEDNIVQLLDGYFVHFFAPENEDPLPKHIIFVLDTSGSMEGIKMEQLKNAMVTILEELTVQDYISIISFTGAIKIWDSVSHKVSEVRNEASRFILELDAGGGTDINEALLTAINQADTLKQHEENVYPIILFLTDGQATAGETNAEIILKNLQNKNHQGEVYVPIISLAFGANADFGLLKDISLSNFGFAKKIYEGTDATIQLERFYQTIAEPVLKNVKFEYVGDIWEKNTVCESGSIPTIFKGGENIAVGKLSPGHKRSASQNIIIIGGEGANGGNKYNHSIGFTDITNISSSSNINFIERLWAFKIIKLLLTTDLEEATNLSLKYNFVTELTSLIVTKPGEEQVEIRGRGQRSLTSLIVTKSDFETGYDYYYETGYDYDYETVYMVGGQAEAWECNECNDGFDKVFAVCCGSKNEKLPPPLTKNSPVLPRTCGKRNEDGVGTAPRRRLRKGVTRFGEWPHVCAIMKQDKTNGTLLNIYQCAASLLSKEVALTAAHCLKDSKNNKEVIFVRCGEWDTSNEDESLPYQEIEVAEIIIHPDFNETNFHNDFALLITCEDFVLDDNISPVCLPFPGEAFGTEDCVSNGWGKDKFGSDGNYLKEVELPLVDNQECQRKLRDTRLGQYFKLNDSFICAGGERGVDTCKGDAGGPLSCRRGDSGQWVQAGIVSWGIGCGDDLPAVYANVAKAACWIDREVSCSYLQETTSSYFGLSPDDCQGDYAIGNCQNTAVPFQIFCL